MVQAMSIVTSDFGRPATALEEANAAEWRRPSPTQRFSSAARRSTSSRNWAGGAHASQQTSTDALGGVDFARRSIANALIAKVLGSHGSATAERRDGLVPDLVSGSRRSVGEVRHALIANVMCRRDRPIAEVRDGLIANTMRFRRRTVAEVCDVLVADSVRGRTAATCVVADSLCPDVLASRLRLHGKCGHHR